MEQGLFLNLGLVVVGIVLDLERDLEKSPHPLIVQDHKESLLAEEILDLHLKTEVDLDLHQSQKYVQTLYKKEE